MTCSWLFAAGGYYRYDRGYDPGFAGTERFEGRIVHPQFWPQDLDYAGKRVVVIGSGATAVTLVPAMTDRAAHVTMLQRTPTYVVALPEKDWIANLLKRRLDPQRAYDLTRRKNIWLQRNVYRLSRSRPGLVRRVLLAAVRRQLPEGYDVGTHFTPPYDPWDQRICAVPDGDLFAAISAGSASVVTDRIATFTEKGLLLESGRELEADVIVTATGLELPDPEIFATQEFKPARLYRLCRSKAYLFRGVEIRWSCDPALIKDETPAEATLHFPGGLSRLPRLGDHRPGDGGGRPLERPGGFPRWCGPRRMGGDLDGARRGLPQHLCQHHPDRAGRHP